MTILDIKLNDDHDIYLDGNDLAAAEEEDIVVQRLRIGLQFLLAEWFLDNTLGIPYVQTIFQAGTNINDIYFIFQNAIINTEGVETLNELILTPSFDDRSLSVSFSVNENVSLTTIEVAV
jgi:hypothetical protein